MILSEDWIAQAKRDLETAEEQFFWRVSRMQYRRFSHEYHSRCD